MGASGLGMVFVSDGLSAGIPGSCRMGMPFV